MSKICMIPARIGSKRVPQKNLRVLGGRPLISYAIETAVESGIFDQVVVNSDSSVFEGIAEKYGATFYLRPESLGSDDTNNEEFLTDFIEKRCEADDVLVQFLPTSPFVSVDQVVEFVEQLAKPQVSTLVSVEKKQIAAVYGGEPVNFKVSDQHKSSQTMTPVLVYATALMGYKVSAFLSNMREVQAAYHGAGNKTEYFVLDGFATIDIDNEEDFRLAEVTLLARKNPAPVVYFDIVDRFRAEADVPSILKKDGVVQNIFDKENQMIANVQEIIKTMPRDCSWSHRLINSKSNSATLISQLPGEGNREHFHPDWDEWWLILKGEWIWSVEGEDKIIKENELVFIERGKRHKITASGNNPAIRLAVSRADVEHIYFEDVK